MKSLIAGKIKLVVAMLVFGSIGLFVRRIQLSSAGIALVRGMVGALFLLSAALAARQKISWQAVRRNLILLVLSGAAIGGNWILLFQSYKYTTISTATLCYYLAPVIVVIVSPFLLKERLTPVKGICILTALLGMMLVADVFHSQEAGAGNGLGIAYGIGAAALYAGVVLCNKFLQDISALDSTIAQLAAASAVLLPYVLMTEDWGNVSLDVRGTVMLLFVGIVHTGLCYFLYFGSIQSLPAQTAAVLSYIDPVTAIALSTLFLHEPMNLWQGAGAALILGSTLVSELWRPRTRANTL